MKLIDELKKLKQHIEYFNEMSPFPIYDTEYVQEVNRTIKMIEHNKEEYDDMPVVACRHCKSLYIVNDELENDVCIRCGSINEIEHYNNIEQYLDKNKQVK